MRDLRDLQTEKGLGMKFQVRHRNKQHGYNFRRLKIKRIFVF